jgi:hypothetical protein
MTQNDADRDGSLRVVGQIAAPGRLVCMRWQDVVEDPAPGGPFLRFSCECGGVGCPFGPDGGMLRCVHGRYHLDPCLGCGRRYVDGELVGRFDRG